MNNLQKWQPKSPDKETTARLFAQAHVLSFAIGMNERYQAAEHLRVIANSLHRLEQRKIKKVMFFLPPRHGKSFLVSQYFPAWYLGRHPEHNFIMASYSQDLATDFGRQVRNLMQEENYKALFPGICLADDSTAASRFHTNHGGACYSVGVGSSLTGRGGDCLVGETLISTERGEFRLDELAQMKNPPRVWSYNHEKEKLELCKILASRKINNVKVLDVYTSSGSVLTCTHDHRIFSDRDYRAAQKVKPGSRLLGLNNKSRLRLLWESFWKKALRIQKSFAPWASGFLLQCQLLNVTSCHQESSHLFGLQGKTNSSKDAKILRGLQTKNNQKNLKRYFLRFLSKILCAQEQQNKILLDDMQKQTPFQDDARRKQLKSPAWKRKKRSLLSYARANFRARQSKMFGLFGGGKFSYSSHQWKKIRQLPGKFNNTLRLLSHHAPQIKKDTVSLVKERSNETHSVYDIQVEGNCNFFANGILVHNCLLIDDPHKDREEANSPTMRDRVWNWYSSTFSTRQMPNAVFLLVMTRWHPDDLAGRILASDDAPNWEVINLPAISPDNQALWPERYPLQSLESIKKAMILADWQSLYMQHPTLQEGAIIKRHWWRFYKHGTLPKMEKEIQTWDFAVKDKHTSDYTVGLVVGKHGANRYVLDMIRERLSFPDACQAVVRLSEKWPNARKKLVESKANGPAVIQTLRNKISGLVEFEPEGDKVQRLSSVAPEIESGNWYLPDPKEQPWVNTLLQEISDFPNSTNDDICDVVSMSGIELRGSGRIGTIQIIDRSW